MGRRPAQCPGIMRALERRRRAVVHGGETGRVRHAPGNQECGDTGEQSDGCVDGATVAEADALGHREPAEEGTGGGPEPSDAGGDPQGRGADLVREVEGHEAEEHRLGRGRAGDEEGGRPTRAPTS